MSNNGTETRPAWLANDDRIEKQCDERHSDYQRRIGQNEGRLQQLFGDERTKEPGALAAMRKEITETKDIALSTKRTATETKTEVATLKVKIAALLIALQAIAWVLTNYVLKPH